MKLITDQEAAEIFRCSTDKIKRLRLSGKLAYIPGRPVKINEADLLAFIEASTIRSVPPDPPTAPKPDADASARAWALKAMLKPKRAPRSK
ncbi:helix-turn-helix domain-containing protein [Rhizobium sp. WYJ-E13]|uniref:helix-turn-helix domain-containing protein n=1 Tax=Rhizobium sp. WYJ-E13 TaxID=2849093 RepID=UPI001C1EBA28|nr:helix-turn-helix domain-containing protein [Rhizobium sp. WYJ-E13]QWW67969.1 helix-turn-helix domain-containing protein [Rhizobium sp. WYJ-E13]